jgi:hypothetical protein
MLAQLWRYPERIDDRPFFMQAGATMALPNRSRRAKRMQAVILLASSISICQVLGPQERCSVTVRNIADSD